MEDRAAQFAPFSALTGHDAAIAETARITNRCIELTEDEQMELSRKIIHATESGAAVSITYFIPDKHKDGGRYTRVRGHIRKVDEYNCRIVLAEGMTIPLKSIYSLD